MSSRNNQLNGREKRRIKRKIKVTLKYLLYYHLSLIIDSIAFISSSNKRHSCHDHDRFCLNTVLTWNLSLTDFFKQSVDVERRRGVGFLDFSRVCLQRCVGGARARRAKKSVFRTCKKLPAEQALLRTYYIFISFSVITALPPPHTMPTHSLWSNHGVEYFCHGQS